MQVAFGAAFLAGLLSVTSPCVLPLIPVYAAYLAGSQAQNRWHLIGQSALFVFGFSLVFIALGATATALGATLAAHAILVERIGGGLVIVFGLVTLGVLPVAWFWRTVRAQTMRPGGGALGAFILGLAFAAGWTPCVGPILATILLLAAATHTAVQGALLLAVYSIGLGVPFVVLAVIATPLMATLRSQPSFLVWSERAAGLLMLVLGTAMAFGLFGRLAGISF